LVTADVAAGAPIHLSLDGLGSVMSLAFDFTRQFFQPCRIGRVANHSTQVGGNRRGIVFVFDRLRFPRWLWAYG
jgi:hypothetical protein